MPVGRRTDAAIFISQILFNRCELQHRTSQSQPRSIEHISTKIASLGEMGVIMKAVCRRVTIAANA